jgi:protein O-GlcNAc transferase
MQGSHFASRMSSSILSAIGLPEMVADCLDQYESLAVGLAGNARKLKRLREKLANNRKTEPLFDTTQFVKHLENAYEEMLKIFLAGEETRNIKVIEREAHQSGDINGEKNG